MARPGEARLTVDEHMKVTAWNAAAERLTGWTAKEMIGKPLKDLLPLLLADLPFDQLHNALVSDGLLHRDVVVICRDGSSIYADIHIGIEQVSGTNGRRLHMSLREITDRKQAEEALREAETRVSELERRLRQVELRTSDLESRLQRSEQERNDYIGTLSHELRNPLAAIVLGITLLKSASPGSEQAHRAVEIMQRQTKHLARMVDEMLDVARISEKRIELRKERIDLGQLVQRTIQDYQSVFLNKKITVSTDLPAMPIWLDGDPMRLGQALGNLLDNAAKFTSEKGRVNVTVGIDPAEGAHHALITVADTGIGLQPGILQNVFEPLVQADTSLRRGPSGLGLGLSLVKGIVELHGGTVEAASDGPGMGARFTIRLPLGSASGPETVPHRALPERAHRPGQPDRAHRSGRHEEQRRQGPGGRKPQSTDKPRRRPRGDQSSTESEPQAGS